MCVIPIRARLAIDCKSVCEGGLGCNRTLGHADGAVHEIGAILKEAVEMDGGRVDGLIVDVNNDGVAIVTFDKWTWELIIDEIHRTVHAVRVEISIGDGPVVLARGRSSIVIP